MTAFPHKLKTSTCTSIFALVFCLSGFSAGMANTVDQEGATNAAVNVIMTHPNVARARAEVCQAASQYDFAAAAAYPQIDLSLRGGSSLASHIEDSATNERRFENREVDAVIGINQLIYDFGGVKASKLAALSDQSAGRIGLKLEIDRIAANILEIGLRLSEQHEQLAIYENHLKDLDQHIERIEAGVKAGVLRTGDLRSIKVIALDAEIAITASKRQIELLHSELFQRFGLEEKDVHQLMAHFRLQKPHLPPVIDSLTSREVRQIDQRIISAGHEITRLRSERLPRLTTSIDSTFFDIDSYSQEFEVVGQLQMTLPLYDGGSNKARRAEEDWRRRGLMNERESVIRNHRNATETTRQNIETARDSLARNEEKIAALKDQLAEAEARLGETSGDVLSIAGLKQRLAGILVEQVTLSHQVDFGLLQGVFFADELSDLLALPNGGPQC